jgi:hypothetical protein
MYLKKKTNNWNILTPANQGFDWMSSANTITSTNAFSETGKH